MDDDDLCNIAVIVLIVCVLVVGTVVYNIILHTDTYYIGRHAGFDEHNYCIYTNALDIQNDYFLEIGGIKNDSYMYMLGYIDGYHMYIDEHNRNISIQNIRKNSGC